MIKKIYVDNPSEYFFVSVCFHCYFTTYLTTYFSLGTVFTIGRVLSCFISEVNLIIIPRRFTSSVPFNFVPESKENHFIPVHSHNLLLMWQYLLSS